jgi:hypothetical protein
MTHLLVLVILSATYTVARLVLRAEDKPTPTPAPAPRRGAERGEEPAEAASPGGLAWTAVDDRQLTRLLRSSAARSTRTGKRA